jgi:hypothetical protein
MLELRQTPRHRQHQAAMWGRNLETCTLRMAYAKILADQITVPSNRTDPYRGDRRNPSNRELAVGPALPMCSLPVVSGRGMTD